MAICMTRWVGWLGGVGSAQGWVGLGAAQGWVGGVEWRGWGAGVVLGRGWSLGMQCNGKQSQSASQPAMTCYQPGSQGSCEATNPSALPSPTTLA